MIQQIKSNSSFSFPGYPTIHGHVTSVAMDIKSHKASDKVTPQHNKDGTDQIVISFPSYPTIYGHATSLASEKIAPQ